MALLEIKGLKTHFKTDDGWLHAVDGVDISIDRGTEGRLVARNIFLDGNSFENSASVRKSAAIRFSLSRLLRNSGRRGSRSRRSSFFFIRRSPDWLRRSSLRNLRQTSRKQIHWQRAALSKTCLIRN